MSTRHGGFLIPYGVSDFRTIPALAKGTTLHLLLVQYRGPKMILCEQIFENKI